MRGTSYGPGSLLEAGELTTVFPCAEETLTELCLKVPLSSSYTSSPCPPAPLHTCMHARTHARTHTHIHTSLTLSTPLLLILNVTTCFGLLSHVLSSPFPLRHFCPGNYKQVKRMSAVEWASPTVASVMEGTISWHPLSTLRCRAQAAGSMKACV